MRDEALFFWQAQLRESHSKFTHATSQQTQNKSTLANMQFTTAFLFTALSGIAFALPQADPVDCPETAAIPTCGVSNIPPFAKYLLSWLLITSL